MTTQCPFASLRGSRQSRPRGFTLVEILITAVIVTICGLSIIVSIQTAILFQQTIREENGAMRAAADMIDMTRKELFFRMQSHEREVVIDNRGTAQTDDDILGVARIRFFAPDANGDYFNSSGQYAREVGHGNVPLAYDLTMLIAEVTVTWNRVGRLSDVEREVTLTALLAP